MKNANENRGKSGLAKAVLAKAVLAMLIAASLLFSGCVMRMPVSTRKLEEQMDRLERELDDLSEKIGQHTDGQEERIVYIEVYDAQTDALLTTIDDQARIDQFGKLMGRSADLYFDDISSLASGLMDVFGKPKNETPALRFDAYMSSVGKLDAGKAYYALSLTTYVGSRLVTLEVTKEAVKNMSLPENWLTFTWELSEKDVEALTALGR